MKILKFIKKIALGFLLIILIIINLMIFVVISRIWSYYMSPWEIFEVVKLEDIKYYDFKGLSFADEQNGIMWGKYQDADLVYREDGSLTRSIKEKSYFIFESKNGGKKWIQIYKSENEIISISHVTDKLFFALVKIQPKDNSPEYFQILRFENDFNTFINIVKMQGLMNKIFFLDREVGFILGYNAWSQYLTIIMMTKDGGKNWQTLQLKYPPDRYKQFIKYDDNKLYYFSDNKCILLDINSMKEDVMDFPQEAMKISNICLDDKKRLWLLGRGESDTIILFRQKDNNDFERVRMPFFENKKLSPEFIHTYDNIIFVFLVDYSSFFPHWEFYISSDDGLTWHQEKLPLRLVTDLMPFCKDNNIWVYSPDGRLQHRHYPVRSKLNGS